MKSLKLKAILFFLLVLLGCKQNQNESSNNAARVEVKPQPILKDNGPLSSDVAIKSTLAKFAKALEKKDSFLLDSIIGPGGFTIIRNFTSGSYGARGKNIRYFYPTPIKEKALSFPVENEIPVNLNSLFPNLLALKSKPLLIKNDTIDFMFSDDSTHRNPPTDSLISIFNRVLLKTKDTEGPYIILIGDSYAILVDEGETSDNIPTGDFTIFTKVGEKYYLKAIIDFR